MVDESEELESIVRAQLRARVVSQYIQGFDYHFAGYFNELGIVVKLSQETPPAELERVATMALEYLNEVLPEGDAPFCWQISFSQSGKQVALFFPGDSFADNCAVP